MLLVEEIFALAIFLRQSCSSKTRTIGGNSRTDFCCNVLCYYAVWRGCEKRDRIYFMLESKSEKFGIPYNFSQEKEEKLRLCYKNLEQYGEDGIDSKIKDTIAYLNALDFNTSESCEGHVDHGNLSPYVGMKESKPPQWRFAGEEQSFEKAATKHGVTVSEILDYGKPKYDVENLTHPKNEEQIILAMDEAWKETPKNKETDEFIRWRAKTDEMKEKLNVLIQEFYKERTADDDVKLALETDNDPNRRSTYQFFLHNGGKDYENYHDYEEREKLNEEEMNILKKRLESRQNEMKDFTEFLKEKYNEM